MRETLTFLLRAAALPTEAIAPAVRLAAELSVQVVLTEDKAVVAANVRASVWNRIRPSLADLFEFSAGRVRLRDAEDLDGLELLALQVAAREKRQRPVKPSNDPQVHSLVDLGMDENDAKKFVRYANRTYGASNFESALRVAQERRPDDPKSYIIRVIQQRIAPTTGNTVPGVEPRKVLRQVKVLNPEAARSERLGWEAPTFNELGAPSYPGKVRREVWRNRTGTVQLFEPGPGTKIPTPLEDAGLQIVESLR